MFFDPSKAIRELGFPQTPVETALSDAIAWFRQNGYVKRQKKRRPGAEAAGKELFEFPLLRIEVLMRFPISLYVSMTSYLVGKKLRGVERFPLVLMLEPTHRCNLTCAGCGRIREYHDTLSQEMSLEDCMTSIEEAGTPVVTITGGEPLLYSHAPQLVEETLGRGRHIYFCTNGLLLEESLSLFRPNPRFTWNVHFDGTEHVHDAIIGKPGGFSKALAGVKAAKAKGFRVSTNTTVYRDSSVSDIAKLFQQLTKAGVDGILVAPGFSYEEVVAGRLPDQK